MRKHSRKPIQVTYYRYSTESLSRLVFCILKSRGATKLDIQVPEDQQTMNRDLRCFGCHGTESVTGH